MSERLVLQKIHDPSKKFAISRLLASLPTLDSARAKMQLEHLPWTLPDLPDPNRRASLRNALEKLGCEISLTLQEDPLPIKVSSSKKSQESIQDSESILDDYLASQENSSSQKNPPEMVSRSHVSMISNTKNTTLPKESLEFSVKAKTSTQVSIKKSKKNLFMILWVTSFFLILGIGFIIFSDSSKQKPELKNTETIELKKNSLSVLKKRKIEERLAQKRELVQSAESYYSEAIHQSFPMDKVGLLKKALSQNPYHLPSWKELLQVHQQLKDHQAYTQTKSQYHFQNEKVRAALQSIAEHFGTVQIPINLDTSKIQLNIYLDDPELEKSSRFGYLVYKEVEPLHPDKMFQATFTNQQGESIQLTVEPESGPLNSSQIEKRFERLR